MSPLIPSLQATTAAGWRRKADALDLAIAALREAGAAEKETQA